MKNKLTLLLPLLALIALLLPTQDSSAKNVAATVAKIRLVAGPGFASAEGSAKISSKPAEKEFQVEAKVSPRLAGSILTVVVDDTVVGTMKINTLGRANLTRNTKLRQSVPVIQPGSLVGVINAGGDIILAGKF
jgi:hypothetical protein